MLKLDLKVNTKNVEHLVGSNFFWLRRIEAASEKVTLRKTHKFLVNSVYSVLKLKRSVLRKDLIKTHLFWGSVNIDGVPISLANYLPLREPRRHKRYGLKIKTYRRKPAKRYRGTFSARGRGNNVQVFRRKGKPRFPLLKYYGPGPADVYTFPGFKEKTIIFVNKTYGREYGRRLGRAIR